MNAHPPVHRSLPSRRSASGRLARPFVIGLLALAVGACGSAPPGPVASPNGSAQGSPDGSHASPSARLGARDGLLVAAGGPLQVVDVDGTLGAFDDRPDPVLAVSAGGGAVIVVDPGFLAWLGTTSGPDPVAWRRFVLPTDGRAERPLLAVSPDGATIALATGPLQGRTFELVLIDIASGAARSIPIERGLNGPPAWLGLESIAVNVIAADQHAGFVAVNVATGVIRDLPIVAFSITASANGSTVATDDPASGEALVGPRAHLDAGDPAGMTRIPSPAGFAADVVAVSGDGMRLAIVRRSDQATSLEILERIDGAWARRAQMTLAADAALAIAWLH